MKNLALFFSFFILAIQVEAQALLSSPSNKSKVVVVTLDSIAPADAYRLTSQLFIDAGYDLEKTDEALLLLSTGWGEKKGFWQVQLALSANVRASGSGSQVRLSGQWRQPNTSADAKAMLGGDFSTSDIEKRTNGGKYWQALEDMAALLGGRVQYF